MSTADQAVVAIVTQVALAADGAVLGVALAYVAARCFFKFAAAKSTVRKIGNATSGNVSDLRSLLDDYHGGEDGGERVERLVVVRGTVESKSGVNGGLKNRLWSSHVLVSRGSGLRAVVIQRSQKFIYNQWRGLFGWYPDVRAVLARARGEQESTSIRTVPFVLVQDRQQPQSDYVVVNLDGSKHPLPLTTVYHQMQPIKASPYTFLQALFGHEYPVGLLDEEKIMPLGKDLTAVGIYSTRNGIPEIKSCKDLPFFLSEMTKDQMLVELSYRAKILVWSGIIVGSISIGILGYAIVRNWNKWKEWLERSRAQWQSHTSAAATAESDNEAGIIEDGGAGDVPDGQLCVICIMRRRRSAFIPCGHLVCCQRCALFVERDLAPKCPVCRQAIHNSVRIYNSSDLATLLHFPGMSNHHAFEQI